MKKSKIFIENILNVLYPRDISCYCCGKELEEKHHYHLCEKCFQNLNFLTETCQKCGDIVKAPEKYCINCKKIKREFDKAFSVVAYENTAVKLVYNYKYGGNKYISEILSELMIEKLKDLNIKIDLVTSVPLNQKRLKSRGFNQADLIAKLICKNLNLKYLDDVFVRIKNTQTQTHLNFDERQENLKDAFIVVDDKRVRNKNVLIIDDIFTTGATMNELAKILKKKHCLNVYCLTFCHTIKNFNSGKN